jgi:hypothetical protein
LTFDYFVFGSNLAGRHGAGAAKEARLKYGAIYGQEVGIQGRSYAIPTKDHKLHTLPLTIIESFVDQFIYLASAWDNKIFFVTRVGCGLAGYKNEDIAPMFKRAPSNCILADSWIKWSRPNG